MNRKFWQYVLWFLSAVLTGFILRCIYARWPNPVSAILAPAVESPWELSKLGFWPCLITMCISRRWGGETTRAADALLLLTQPALLFLVFCAMPADRGWLAMALWLPVQGIAFCIHGFLLVNWPLKRPKFYWALVATLGIAYGLMTLWRLSGEMFAVPSFEMTPLPC